MNRTAEDTMARPAPPVEGGVFARAGAERRADEPRVPSSAGVKALVLLMCAAAAAATAISGVGAASHDYDWPTFAILSIAAAAAQVFVVKTTHHQAYHLAIVFVLAAVLLFPPELVALLCLIQHVPEQFKERYAPEIQSFNVANYVLASLGAWTAAAVVLGSEHAGRDSRTVVAGTVAGAVFVLFNHGLLAAMLRVA